METADHQKAKTADEKIEELRSDMMQYISTTTRLLERIVSDMNDMERKIMFMESDIKHLKRQVHD